MMNGNVDTVRLVLSISKLNIREEILRAVL